ncbi:hypothetical protein, partial [Rosenbergiella epipactidis]|uniref:hypothetical protein n=1 Tax=Rosenbergiella epipactidis TaxID=1544694 RepID=UPI001F4E2C11
YYDKNWHSRLLNLNEKNIKVIIVADDKNFDPTRMYYNLEVVEFNSSTVTQLNLEFDDRVQWRCGDYAYYLAYKKYNFDYAWMIEPDCYLNKISLEDIFTSDNNADFVCAYLRKSDTNWYWHNTSAYGSETYRCFFPLTRISGKLVSAMYKERLKVGNKMNDELFSASFSLNNNFIVDDLSNIKNIKFTTKSYSYTNIHFGPLLKLTSGYFSRNNLYHP